MHNYSDCFEESGKIPGSFAISWEQRKLGDIASSFEYGLNAAAKEYDGENKYIRITDIDDNTHEFLTDNLTSPDIDLTGVDNYKLTEGDILFARTGASVGKSYIYRNSDGLVYYAGFLIRARIKEEYDAVDEGLIERDPTRKAIIKGKTPAVKKIKYLNQFELHNLLASLDLKDKVNWDYFILLVAKTGMRFSDDDDKIRLNQRKPSKYKGLSRFGPEKNLQRINKFMKERPIFYKNLIQMKENFRFYLRCFYCITKVVILQFNSENRTELARNG